MLQVTGRRCSIWMTKQCSILLFWAQVREDSYQHVNFVLTRDLVPASEFVLYLPGEESREKYTSFKHKL
jgi:hypothetical protein